MCLKYIIITFEKINMSSFEIHNLLTKGYEWLCSLLFLGIYAMYRFHQSETGLAVTKASVSLLLVKDVTLVISDF